MFGEIFSKNLTNVTYYLFLGSDITNNSPLYYYTRTHTKLKRDFTRGIFAPKSFIVIVLHDSYAMRKIKCVRHLDLKSRSCETDLNRTYKTT